MILNDVSDWEDYYQFRQYLRCLGLAKNKTINVSEGVRKALRRRKFRFQRRAYDFYNRSLEVDHNYLLSILYPEDKRLKKIPAYHRYVLTLLANDTRQNAADVLNTNRDYINEWTKDHGYTVAPLARTYISSFALNERACSP